MVISFASGVVGRYFYLQVLQQKTDLRDSIDSYERGFDNYIKISKRGLSADDMTRAKTSALYMATGGVPSDRLRNMTLVEFLFRSISGDINSAFRLPMTPWGGSRPIREKLKEWAFLKRKLVFMHYYHLLFGYWRTFHTPFAVFMYIVAVIHIISSLIFKVG